VITPLIGALGKLVSREQAKLFLVTLITNECSNEIR
jgi:hypothetical protein